MYLRCGQEADGCCLENNLSRNANQRTIRGSCTDQSWSSRDCPLYCVTSKPCQVILFNYQSNPPDYQTGDDPIVSRGMVTYDNVSFRCKGGDNCCNSGDGLLTASSSPLLIFAPWNAANGSYVAIGTTTTTSDVATSTTMTPVTRASALSSATTMIASSTTAMMKSSTTSLATSTITLASQPVSTPTPLSPISHLRPHSISAAELQLAFRSGQSVVPSLLTQNYMCSSLSGGNLGEIAQD
ncbi:hypothetical protein F5Y16DRAFT_264470 [Xylariaceae sp. FL0255]|nr:hypothetical protein F5Y16DRAFT_264470 [Xylariaceae sp. FL0255]